MCETREARRGGGPLGASGTPRGPVALPLCLLLLLTLLSGLLAGCGHPAPAVDTPAQVRRLLDRRAEAVLDRDPAAYARTGAGTPYAALRALPLASWSYRLTSLHVTGKRATAHAELRYRIAGHDRGDAVAERVVGLVREGGGDGGRWSVTTEGPGAGTAQQLWDQGTVRAVRAGRGLVLGAGQDDATLRGYARLVDRAVPAVTDAWGADWPRSVVVLVPSSLSSMAALLGEPASNYRGIAAVTSGRTGGGPPGPADRIVVNPEAYGALSDLGKQVVLTHETTHTATRVRTTKATPMWLSEGYADWVGYRGTGRRAAAAAPELARAVAAGNVPHALPQNTDFRFDGDPDGLARAYEAGWTACLFVADTWGAERLNRFYRAVGAHTDNASVVHDALRDVLGTTSPEFTRRWRAYLVAELG